MSAVDSMVHFPISYQELFSTWSRLNDAVIYAGGTGQIRYRAPSDISPNIISLDKLRELQKISRTERYIEFGAMVTLNKIIHLGKIVPEALISCLQCIGGPQLRNIVTIGGNICNPSCNSDASVPMIALDAQYELRTAQSSRWVSASRFSTQTVLDPQELLTRIRIPLEPWAFTCYRKLNTRGNVKSRGSILLILKNQKSILSSIRVIYSGQVTLRDKMSETMLAGKRLPLDRKDAAAFVDSWKNYLSGISGIENTFSPEEADNLKPELLKTQILNFIETTMLRISE